MKTLLTIFTLSSAALVAQNTADGFKQDFDLGACRMVTQGKNPYFILEPGYRMVLQGIEKRDTVKLVVTVLDVTKKIGGIETRVVEEHESVNGKVIEISRNFFAICEQTGDVYYFGEEVDIYRNGKVTSHSGAWIAEGPLRPGLIMPGRPLQGMKYYQEMAPGIAMDRAEVTGTNGSENTPAGKFLNVLETRETTPLEPDDVSVKKYAPGIGLIRDEALVLISYGIR